MFFVKPCPRHWVRASERSRWDSLRQSPWKLCIPWIRWFPGCIGPAVLCRVDALEMMTHTYSFQLFLVIRWCCGGCISACTHSMMLSTLLPPSFANLFSMFLLESVMFANVCHCSPRLLHSRGLRLLRNRRPWQHLILRWRSHWKVPPLVMLAVNQKLMHRWLHLHHLHRQYQVLLGWNRMRYFGACWSPSMQSNCFLIIEPFWINAPWWYTEHWWYKMVSNNTYSNGVLIVLHVLGFLHCIICANHLS